MHVRCADNGHKSRMASLKGMLSFATEATLESSSNVLSKVGLINRNKIIPQSQR